LFPRLLTFFYESLSVFIRVHPRPIRSFVFKSFANIKSVFICVHLCPDKIFFSCGSAALCPLWLIHEKINRKNHLRRADRGRPGSAGRSPRGGYSLRGLVSPGPEGGRWKDSGLLSFAGGFLTGLPVADAAERGGFGRHSGDHQRFSQGGNRFDAEIGQTTLQTFSSRRLGQEDRPIRSSTVDPEKSYPYSKRGGPAGRRIRWDLRKGFSLFAGGFDIPSREIRISGGN
jgi:hypothetical protein